MKTENDFISEANECEDCTSFSVSKEDSGKRIDSYVSENCDLSRSAVQKLIESGSILINGKAVTKSCRVSENDIITVIFPDPVNMEALPESIPLDIVYEDEYLLVVNKPKGMVVHPAAGNYSGTLVNALLYHCQGSLSGIGGVIRPGIVHRIDKDTSGLLVVAKTDKAHIGLSEQIAKHSFLRSYEAVAVGGFKDNEGIVNAPIGRHPTDRKRMAIVQGGKNAITHFNVIERYKGYTHIKCVLETGRTHQIRVHMSSLGHPLFCDSIYKGGNTDFEKQNAEICKGQLLHARTIGFVHPITGEDMYFESDLPKYFKVILEKLGKRQ